MYSSHEEPGRPTGHDPEVQWRRLDGRLWVGRRGQRTIGTIELGSRYVYVDPDGRPHAGRPTLREAQDEATGPIDLRPMSAALPSGPFGAGRRAAVEIASIAVLAVLAAGLVWAVGSLLFVR